METWRISNLHQQQQHRAAALDHLCSLRGQVAGGALLSLDQDAPAGKGILRNLGKRSQVAHLDRCVGLCARRHHQEATQPVWQSVRNATDFEPRPVRKTPGRYCPSAHSGGPRIDSRRQPADSALKPLGQAWP